MGNIEEKQMIDKPKVPKKFLTDKVLENVGQDKFGHKDLVTQLGNIINEKETPIHIGIFGQWGVGKTSIVKLYKKEIESDIIINGKGVDKEDKIAFITIPVWKYTKDESLRNKFILKIAEELKIDIDELKEEIYGTRTIESPLFTKPKLFLDELKNFKKNFPFKLLIYPFISVILSILILKFCFDFSLKSISDYFSPIALLVLSVLPSMGKHVLRSINSAKVKISFSRFDSAEQFENRFAKMIEKKVCKKIIFIDDLDRCTHQQVIQTLETIKTYLDIEGCVFIIACDPIMIKRAVIQSNEILGYTEQDGTFYLEKFFHHYIFVPPIIPDNMREYAKHMITEVPLSIVHDIPNKKQLDDVIFILAYKDVMNPRKIIVLVNSFVVDFYIAKDREKGDDNLIDGSITKTPQPLAILTVIKHDFSFVFNDLLKHPRLLELIKEKRVNETQDEMIIKRYIFEKSSEQESKNIIGYDGVPDESKGQQPTVKFEADKNVYPLKEDILNLEDFLSLCSDSWIKADITPYLYLTLDETYDAIKDIVDNPRELDKAIRDNKFETIDKAIENAAG
ncbi:MAG: P-loop NTPase fold protein [Nitrosopumilus sp.]